MTKPNVFVTRVLPEAGLNLLKEHCQIEVWPGELPAPRPELLARVKGAQGIVSLLTDRIDAEVMDAAPGLKVICNVAAGYDNIDLAAAKQRGIWVTNLPGVLTETTADLGFALLMAAARRLPEGRDYAKNGHWKTWGMTTLLGQDIHGATLGIAGMGRIGAAIARRGKGFNMRVIYHNRNRNEAAERELGAEYVSKEELLRQSDFLMLIMAYSPAVRHFIDANALAMMKPTSTLINMARGGAVDTDALTQAMREKKIFAAALDVTDPEPLPAAHPLYQLDNVLIVPHLGSASVVTREKMSVMAAQNCIAGVMGQRPENSVE
ncbi:MAG TPA: D-glycerate dehydrogenase [Thermoflexales bacterium]|nr:D-glycerate dehydrogenase [Thermoflexales bacterium]